MVEVPSGLISLWPWPPGSGATALRRWAHGYSTQHGFISQAQPDPPAAQAFRHGLVASAIYLDAYKNFWLRYGPEVADRLATARTLQLGNLSELNGPNPVPKHLMDYWNNYEGVRLAREVAAREGPDITNDRLAQIVADQINASIQAPMGKSRFILFNGYDQHGVNFKDPRLEPDKYDLNRLPNEGWGIGPLPNPEGYIPPAIIEAFPHLYKNPAPGPAPSSAPRWNTEEPADVPDPTVTPPSPAQREGDTTYLDFSRQPNRLGAANPSALTALSAVNQGSDARQQAIATANFGLPQHVIDAGNLLHANGYEITPRTMYLAHVLGPQAAVDLIKRTGSTYSPAVPSADEATGDQMRAWVRALRLGPAAQAIASLAPAPAGTATPGQRDDNLFAASRPIN